MSIQSVLAGLLRDESGQDLIEYSLMSALVGLAAVAAIKTLAITVATSFNTVGSKLTSAI